MSLSNVSTIVSDLFFMVDNRDYFSTMENSSQEDAMEVLLETATHFCFLIEGLGEDYEPQEIVDDYLSRV